MSQPTLAELKPRLRLALQQLAIVPRFESHRAIARQETYGVERAVQLMVESKQDWAPGVPALSAIEDWLSVHWSTNRETRPPAGTVLGDDRLGELLEPQLDVAAAACKLLLAAQLHGAGAVATHAVDFARHGMVEARTMVLLSGGRVAKRTPLDDFVALLPYGRGLETWREATRDAPAELLQPLPENMAGSLCAIELTTFEDRRGGHDEFRRYESPLLRCGLDNLLLILGLVSGRAFRKLAGTHGADDAIRATLPFLYVPSHAPWQRQMAFHEEWTAEHHVTERPLDVQELVRLLRRFADLPEQTQRVLTLAMRRLSDSTERIELEDRVIDLCIALEAMFTDGWQPQLKRVVARRVSWFFADTSAERETTRSQLKQFYAARSAIVHGRVPISRTGNAQSEESRLTALTDDVENVVRTSVADTITDGRPNDWEASRSVAKVRCGRPRPKSETRSIKSESTSWSLAEQEEIDRARGGLEAGTHRTRPRFGPSSANHAGGGQPRGGRALP